MSSFNVDPSMYHHSPQRDVFFFLKLSQKDFQYKNLQTYNFSPTLYNTRNGHQDKPSTLIKSHKSGLLA